MTWHSIDRSGSVISTTPEQLRAQFDWLARCAVSVRHLPDLVSDPGGGPEVALTFDDGFANFQTEALPLLLERGWPATVFVVTRRAGATNQWGAGREATPTLPLMGWDALGGLPGEMVAIGAHTRTHPRLDRLPSASALEDETSGCLADFETQLGLRPAIFAYPYGAVSILAKRVVARHFHWAVGTRLQPLSPGADRHQLPRIDSYYLRQPQQLGRWGSWRLRGWLGLRASARRFRRTVRQEPAE